MSSEQRHDSQGSTDHPKSRQLRSNFHQNRKNATIQNEPPSLQFGQMKAKSIPGNMSLLAQTQPQQNDNLAPKSPTKNKKKLSAFSKLLQKAASRQETSPPQRLSTSSLSSQHESQHMMDSTEIREAELDMIHSLMASPQDMGLSADQDELESTGPDVHDVDRNLDEEATRFVHTLEQIDVTNARVLTLENLAGTAAISNEQTALNFLQNAISRMRDKQADLIELADQTLEQLTENPNILFVKTDADTSKYRREHVSFHIPNEDEPIELISADFKTVSSDEDSEGPPPEEVIRIAHQIRQEEGIRFKQMLHHNKPKSTHHHHHHHQDETPDSCVNDAPIVPPPPNPLGHTRRELLRNHITVPSGLCQQSEHSSSSSSIVSGQTQRTGGGESRRHVSTTIPFNLLSLTGQLSWLVGEYLERGSSTYQWANELIRTVTRLSVSRGTWLNLHQQLRQTTELLYTHSGQPTAAATAKGQIAWSHLQTTREQLCDTLANTGSSQLHKTSESRPKPTSFVHLSVLLEKKFHLAYVCDLFLSRALTVMNEEASNTTSGRRLSEEMIILAKQKLNNFAIRLLQLKLDQANVQNWCPEVTDWLICCLQLMEDNETTAETLTITEQKFCIDELRMFGQSVNHFKQLLDEINAFMIDGISLVKRTHQFDLEESGVSGGNSNIIHAHHHHYHYHHNRHCPTSNQLAHDLRSLDADRCAHKYSELVRQIHEHAMNERPLVYFAERAFYDIALELNCPIDWKERLASLRSELVDAWQMWEQFLAKIIGPPFAT